MVDGGENLFHALLCDDLPVVLDEGPHEKLGLGAGRVVDQLGQLSKEGGGGH